jgi:plastocyanin
MLVLAVAALALAGCAPAEEGAPGVGETPGLEATEPLLETPMLEETEALETPTLEETEALETPMLEETEALPPTGPGVVTVQLMEYEINMPQSIPAGPTTFQVTNAGTEEHSFAIEGQGVDESLETPLQPGESQELEVDLQPGTYTVYCPVDDHADQGMSLELTVTEATTQ